MSALALNRLTTTSFRRLLVSRSDLRACTTSKAAACRYFSTDGPDLDYIRKYYQVHRRGDAGHGSREYLLLPPEKRLEDVKADSSLSVAALLAHRNIVFGARAFHEYNLADVCMPLVEVAVKEAGENGEQPQAIASLSGLSNWVTACLETNESLELNKLKENDTVSFEAVQAMATGIPRSGHSVVGMGTYRDGEEGWKKLATEFIGNGLSEEASLYQERGASLVGIEHMADRNPDYVQSAGGAMARLFFL